MNPFLSSLVRRRASVALVLLAAGSWLAAAEDFCLNCHDHRKQRELFLGSAHAQAGVTCRDCHGGDAKAKDETAHVSADFKRPDNKKAIAELCARCHSDVRRMNPYGLPVDQLDRYKTSKHGEQLFGKNDQKVAVCTDCHGVHDIHKAKSPQSHVHPTRIPDTCGRCHSDAKLMAEYKLPADAVAQYKTSYHAQMVFEKGDLSAPTCVTCHGNHGATPPGAAEVGQVCGKCHVRQRELFEKSPHLEAAKVGVFKECVSCHGNHAIQKTSLDLFAKACAQCHLASEAKPIGVRDNMVRLISLAKDAHQKAVARVREATIRGLATDDEQLLLQQADTQVKQLEALQHTLALDQLKPVVDQSDQLVKQIVAGVKRLEQVERLKRVWLVPSALFLGVMAILFWRKRGQIERREAAAKPEGGVSRRTVLDWLLGGGLFVWLVAIVAPVISYVWPAQRRGPSVQTVSAGKAAEFAEWQAKVVAVGGQPVIVVRTPQGFRAFSAICTHLGCIVIWDDQRRQIACPCHAGFFDVTGRVVSGPPPRPLPEHGVAVVNGEVMVRSA